MDYTSISSMKFKYKGRTRRGLKELFSLCEGFLKDDEITPDELVELAQWCEQYVDNVCEADIFMEFANELNEVITNSAENGLTASDYKSIKDIIVKFLAKKPKNLIDEVVKSDTPFDDPMPDVVFKDKIFVLTGVFTSVSDRGEIERLITLCGGTIGERVTLKTDYLVVGEVANASWKFGNFGNKINSVLDNKRAYGDRVKTAIISEQHLLSFIV